MSPQNGECCNEEKGEGGREEDPVREEATEVESAVGSSASSDGNRHRIQYIYILYVYVYVWVRNEMGVLE